MKKVTLIFLIALIGMATSCFQRSCPTYTKNTEKAPIEKKVEVNEDQRI